MTWGKYAFSRDFVDSKIPDELKKEIIIKSYDCGKEEVSLLFERVGKFSPIEYINKFELKLIEKKTSENIDTHFLFAQFNPPNEIAIYPENIAAINELLIHSKEYGLSQYVDPTNAVLAHELFHYLESSSKMLYTTAVKVPLWRFLRFTYTSTLIAPGEIAAMSFAREMLSLPYNPFIYDILLAYAKDKERGVELIQKLNDLEKCL